MVKVLIDKRRVRVVGCWDDDLVFMNKGYLWYLLRIGIFIEKVLDMVLRVE